MRPSCMRGSHAVSSSGECRRRHPQRSARSRQGSSLKMVRTALSSRMGRRMAAALAISSVLPLGVFRLAAGPLDPAAQHALAGAVLLAIVSVSVRHLSRRYVPALHAAQRCIDGLGESRFVAPRACGSDEPRALLEALASCTSSLEERFRTVETLAEIDRLLLGAAGIEPVLEAMLARVQALTHCHGAGITLRDSD